MANAEAESKVRDLISVERTREAGEGEESREGRGGGPGGEPIREIVAPGHPYNHRTGTGIEWIPANPGTGELGKIRLWGREWNGQPSLLAQAEHAAGSAWEYWYDLQFARSFPQVTHWWFGDAWTGHVRIWEPDATGVDPESGAPMLIGWMCFGVQGVPGVQGVQGVSGISGVTDGDATVSNAAQPWSVVITNPPRINTPLPPMATSIANLPLQLLLGENIMEMLGRLATQTMHGRESAGTTSLDMAITVTSLVRREDLQRALPTHFGSWRLDRVPGLTPREALCRVQGLDPVVQPN